MTGSSRHDARWLACNTVFSNAWEELHACVETTLNKCPFTGIVEQVFDTSRATANIESFCYAHRLMQYFVEDVLADHKAPGEPSTVKSSDAHVELLSAVAKHEQKRAREQRDVDEHGLIEVYHHLIVCTVSGALRVECDWNMPNVKRRLSMTAASSMYTAGATNVQIYRPMAGIQVPLSQAVVNAMEPLLYEFVPEGLGKVTVREALSLRWDANQVEFYSTVFTSWPFSERGDCGTFGLRPAYRYSRFATTAMLRQLYAIGVNLPVFGVFFKGLFAYVHVDWASEEDGYMKTNSVVILEDEETRWMKRWDLRKLGDLVDLRAVLENLQEYTTKVFTCRVEEALGGLKQRVDEGKVIAWRWNGIIPLADETDIDETDEDEDGEADEMIKDSAVHTESKDLRVRRVQTHRLRTRRAQHTRKVLGREERQRQALYNARRRRMDKHKDC